VLGAQALPLVVLLLFGGVWADRLPRHRIMIATDVVRGVAHALLAALIFTGAVRVWEVVAIEIVFGAGQAFFQPAYTGLIPQTVPDHMVQDARALSESIENVAFMLGPVIATALVLGVGAGVAFTFDAATFAISALMLMRVRPRARGESAGPPAGILHSLREGWVEVRSRAWVWVTIATFAGAVLTTYAPWYALAPLISRDVYGSTGVFGVLESVAGVGAVVGALVGVRWRPRRPLFLGLVMILSWPVTDLAFALAAPLAVMIALNALLGFGFALLTIWWETALAEHIPPGALSRVSAYDWMGSLALLPLGFLVAGPLASAVGARLVLGVGSVIGFALLLLALVPRSTRELGSPSARPPGVQLDGAAAAALDGVSELQPSSSTARSA
jgi:MFS family permease